MPTPDWPTAPAREANRAATWPANRRRRRIRIRIPAERGRGPAFRNHAGRCPGRPGPGRRSTSRDALRNAPGRHGRRPRRHRAVGGQGLPQPMVVFRLPLRIEQAHAGGRQLVEDKLRDLRVGPRLKSPHVEHLPVGRIGDHIRIRFEQADAQQPVMVGRLLVGRDAKPFPIRIKPSHAGTPPMHRPLMAPSSADNPACFLFVAGRPLLFHYVPPAPDWQSAVHGECPDFRGEDGRKWDRAPSGAPTGSPPGVFGRVGTERTAPSLSRGGCVADPSTVC